MSIIPAVLKRSFLAGLLTMFLLAALLSTSLKCGAKDYAFIYKLPMIAQNKFIRLVSDKPITKAQAQEVISTVETAYDFDLDKFKDEFPEHFGTKLADAQIQFVRMIKQTEKHPDQRFAKTILMTKKPGSPDQ